MKKKILLITQWFEPEPVARGIDFARKLQELGNTVQVITGFPNYPGGKIYDGYKIKLWQKEIVQGVNILRVPLYPSHNQSKHYRIFNYLSFSISTTIFGLFYAMKADVIYAYHPPLSVGFSALIIKFFTRKPVILDIQDIWPDTLRASQMISSEKLLNRIGKMCDLLYKKVDFISVISPGFKNLLIERGVNSKKIEIIYNWVAENEDANVAQELPQFDSEKFNIVFAGNIGKAQGLVSVVHAAKILLEQGNPTKIQFIFIGSGLDLDLIKKMAEGLSNVSFISRQPQSLIGSYLSKADALLVHLKADPLFEITIPSKTQAYLRCGKPILMAVKGDAALIIERAECGEFAESENPQSIANAALELSKKSSADLKKMSETARQYYDKEMSLTVGVNRFNTVMNSILKK